MAKRYYAAYGSNLNIRQMKLRCPDARIIGTAFIEGYELLFKGSRTGSCLTIEPGVKNHVPVGIWEVTENDELSLDRYEGYPVCYYKKEFRIPVRKTNNQIEMMKTFVYIMDERRPAGLPSSHYLDVCTKGYRDFGFDPKYLQEALERSRRNENNKHEKNLPSVQKRIYRLSGHLKKRQQH